ncbi:DUF7848 domain-containing protein [Streptomyces sp. NPDC001515]
MGRGPSAPERRVRHRADPRRSRGRRPGGPAGSLPVLLHHAGRRAHLGRPRYPGAGPGLARRDPPEPPRAGPRPALESLPWRSVGHGRGRVTCGPGGCSYPASGGWSMIRSVIRHTDWRLGVDTRPEAPGPVFEMECTTCGQSSEAASHTEDPEVWALRHTGRNTSHRSYQATITSFFRVTPAPGNPLHERGQTH